MPGESPYPTLPSAAHTTPPLLDDQDASTWGDRMEGVVTPRDTSAQPEAARPARATRAERRAARRVRQLKEATPEERAIISAQRARDAAFKSRAVNTAVMSADDREDLACLLAVVRTGDRGATATAALNAAARAYGAIYSGRRAARGDVYTVDPRRRATAVVGLRQKGYLAVDLSAHACWHQGSAAERAACTIIAPAVPTDQVGSLLKALCQWTGTMAVVSADLSTYARDNTKFCHIKLQCGSATFTATTMTWLHEQGVFAHVDRDGRLEAHRLRTRAPLTTQWFRDHKVSEWLVVKNDPVGWSPRRSLLLCVPDLWPEVKLLLEKEDMLLEELPLPDDFKIPPPPRQRHPADNGHTANRSQVPAPTGSSTAITDGAAANQAPRPPRTGYAAAAARPPAVDPQVAQLQRENQELRASNDELRQQLANLTMRMDAFLGKVDQPPAVMTELTGTVRTHAVQLSNLQSTVNILVEKINETIRTVAKALHQTMAPANVPPTTPSLPSSPTKPGRPGTRSSTATPRR